MNFKNRTGHGGGRPLTEDEPLNETLKIMLSGGMCKAIEEQA